MNINFQKLANPKGRGCALHSTPTLEEGKECSVGGPRTKSVREPLGSYNNMQGTMQKSLEYNLLKIHRINPN